MSFFPPQFQIASDLHLETPLTSPQYTSFHLNVLADNLLLLGDIGLVVDTGLFDFLRRLLDENRGCHIFYILGNHEPYRTTYRHAYQRLREFETEAKRHHGSRFHFLCRDRYDVDKDITILGCTLWSSILPVQEYAITSRSTDFHPDRGIQHWTLVCHRTEHAKDVAWLNTQVAMIEEKEPHRHIIIATHHCHTIDPRASDPRHVESEVSSNFTTDLLREKCWLSTNVKVWCFGHTHFSCEWREEGTGKLVVANQKGYLRIEAGGKKMLGLKLKMVQMGKEGWEVIGKGKESAGDVKNVRVPRTGREEVGAGEVVHGMKVHQPSLICRVMQRIKSLRSSRQESRQ
jgi:hypothetical protein